MTGKTKGQWASLPSRLCVLLMPHHQGFTSPIYLILFGPPTCAPLFMHYVKKFETAFSFFPPSLSISHPLPAPPPSISPSPPPPLLSNFFFPLSSLALHPAFTHFALLELVCVWICLRSVFFVDWLPARTVKALPAARTWKMHRISLW